MISIGGADHYKGFPRSSFKVDKEQDNVVLNVTREQLQPEFAQTDLSPDVMKVAEDQLQTLRTSEPRKAEERERFSGGPLGEGDAGGSRSYGK
jgi:hypothetical protein